MSLKYTAEKVPTLDSCPHAVGINPPIPINVLGTDFELMEGNGPGHLIMCTTNTGANSKPQAETKKTHTTLVPVARPPLVMVRSDPPDCELDKTTMDD